MLAAIIIALSIGLGGFSYVLYRAWQEDRREQGSWRFLPSQPRRVPEAVQCQGTPTQLDALGWHLGHACELLTALGPWETNDVYRALYGVRVVVLSTEHWPAMIGLHDGLMPGVRVITVGPRFLGLAHALAHIIEDDSGLLDPYHRYWATNGTAAAVKAYELKVMG